MNKTIIIFDWDDTLFPSQWLYNNNFDLNVEILEESAIHKDFHKLEITLCELLNRAIISGKCYIVTNSEEGWVRKASKKFVPQILQYLDKIKIISARSIYEKMFPNSPIKWKYIIIRNILYKYHHKNKEEPVNDKKQIISFGDSMIEKIAVLYAINDMNWLNKNIKFIDKPTMQEIIKQHIIIIKNFDNILSEKDNLDLQLSLILNDCD